MNGEADLVDLLPSIVIGLMRLVTIAFACNLHGCSRLLLFRRRAAPGRSANSAGISTKGSGTNWTFIGLFFVQ